MPLVTGPQCVSFVKAAIPGLYGKTTAMWVKGCDLKNGTELPVGTAIATFVNGKYLRTEPAMPPSTWAGMPRVFRSWINGRSKARF